MTNFWTIAQEILRQVGPGALTLLGIWVNYRNGKKNKPDLGRSVKRSDIVKPLLEEVRYSLGSVRCIEWAVSNGDVTLGGHHLQKLSIITEAVEEGFESMQNAFQLVPITQFSRTLESLKDKDATVSHEDQFHDDMAILSSRYDVKTILIVKIKGDYDKWIGMLGVAWEDHREVSDEDIAYVKLQASRLGAIKS